MDAISRLGLDIETAGLVRGERALDNFNRKTQQAERSATQLEQAQRRVSSGMNVMAGLAQNLAAQLGAVFSVMAVIRAGDTWTAAANQLRLAVSSASQLRAIQAEVFDLAQRTASAYEGMAGLYSSIQRAAGEQIGSQREVLRITETIAKLAAASGGPAGSRNAALFQLRQMLQGAYVQAQEFNSLIDGTPLLVQAIADSLGVTRAELRRMVLDGRLAVTDVIAALQEQADETDAIFSRVVFTVGDSFVRLQNAFQRLVGTNLGGVLGSLATGITLLAENLDMLIPVISGVGIAFVIHFAGVALSAVGKLRTGLATLFAFMGAHPFAIIAGALTAAVIAMNQFGDAMVVGQARVDHFTKSFEKIDEEVGKAFRNVKQTVDVTLRDVVDALFLDLRDGVAEVAVEIGDVLASIATEFTQNDVSGAELFAGWIDGAKQTGNFIIGIIQTFWDAARITFPRIGDILIVEFTRGANGAIGALEQLLNAMRRLQDPLGLSPEIQLPRLEAPAAAMERLARASTEFTASLRENFSRDWIGEVLDHVMERASALAVARAAAADQAAQEAEAAAAANAAAAAAAANADALQKQIEARQALFDELNAQLTLSEREFAIYQETEQLLRQFPDYYRSIAAGAADVAAAAREAADADARRLDSLRRQISAIQSIRTLNRDAYRIEELTAAAQISFEELEIRERTLDLLEEHADLYEQLGEGASAAARAEAERQIAAERTLDVLTEQAERMRDIARAPAENLMEGLEDATDDFWDNFVEKGFGAFDDLGNSLKSIWRRLQADILRATFEPFIAQIRNAITGAVQGGAGQGSGGLLSSIVNSIGSLFGRGSGNGQQAAGGSFGGGVGGWVNGGFGGFLDQIFGPGGSLSMTGHEGTHSGAGGLSGMLGQAGGLLGQIGQSFAMAQIGSGIAQALGLVKKAKGGAIGGAIGGTIGAFVGGPIGSAIGSFIGSTIGGLFGPGVTSAQTALDMNASGGITRGPWGVGGDDEMTPETQEAVRAAADRIAQGQDLIRQLGGTLGAYVAQISIAAERQRSGIRLNSTTTGQEVGVVHTDTIADPDDLVSTALREVLARTDFADPVLEAVREAMMGAGQSFESTLEVLGKLKDVLPATEEATSQWKQALDTLNSTFADLRAQTAGVAGVAAQLDQAFAKAKDALKKSFTDSIEDAITAIENPVELAFEELMKAQAQRLADAHALGADVARVMHLNELELKGFIEQAGGSADAFANLNEIFAELIAKAAAAGQATQPLVDAYNDARAGVVNAFDDQVADQLANLSNPTLGALRSLLEAQEARLEQARSIGANILAVERLNALEQKAFFESLTDEQRIALGSYLGMIEDFTGKISLTLSQLNDELSARIDNVETLRNDLLRQSESMRSLSENLGAARQNIVDRYGAITPMAGVDALRERFANLAEEARGGNDSALQALGQVGEQLIQASRQLYGSTTTFRGDFDLVTAVLQEAEVLAAARADTLESQAETLVAQRDLLIQIRDILSHPDPALDALQVHLEQLGAGNELIASLLEEYLQLAMAQDSQPLDLGALFAQAAALAQAPPVTATAPVYTPVTPGASPSSSSQNTQTPSASPGTDTTNQMLAAQIDVLNDGFTNLREGLDDIRREQFRLNDQLIQQKVAV